MGGRTARIASSQLNINAGGVCVLWGGRGPLCVFIPVFLSSFCLFGDSLRFRGFLCIWDTRSVLNSRRVMDRILDFYELIEM